MASLTKRGEYWSCRFTDAANNRCTVALDTKSERTARKLMMKIESVLESKKNGQPLDAETSAWIESLNESNNKLKPRLVKYGLIENMASEEGRPLTLEVMLQRYVDKRTDVKPATKTNWQHTCRNLLAFFGEGKIVSDITVGDAKDFERHLKSDARKNRYGKVEADAGLSPDTIRKRISNAKQFFADAVDREVIPRNPFAKLKSGVKGNRDRDFFVKREAIEKVIEACPDAEWRLIVALSRYGGLRCPSEHLGLRLDDVDWDRNRIRITSPKTEHHEGKAWRWIPLFPELRPFLDAIWQAAEPGQEYFISRYRRTNQNLRTQLQKIIGRAGLVPWPKLFHNMRASRQTELTEDFPSHVVCTWIGNSPNVAKKHYLQVTDAHFEKAAGAARTICARTASQGVVNKESDAAEPAIIRGKSQHVAISVGDTGFEPVTSAV